MNHINCPFCNPNNLDIAIKNKLSYARFDKYPVNTGHILIVPNRHFANFFDSSNDEKIAIWDLIDEGKQLLEKKYTPDGYNIGINVGKAAGQTVMHLHVHLIPRYKGDIDNPIGGVRGVIPEKRIY